MTKYDGSIESGAYIANTARAGAIAGWQITGEGDSYSKRSMSESAGTGKDGDSINVEDKIADDADIEYMRVLSESINRMPRDVKMR